MYVKCQKFLGGFQGFRGGLKIVNKIQVEYIKRKRRKGGKKGIKQSNKLVWSKVKMHIHHAGH